jgi:hypothetical protein
VPKLAIQRNLKSDYPKLGYLWHVPAEQRFVRAPVKEQYVGDVNDFRKYALLRRLAAVGAKIGVCWMLTPPDGRPDGNKLGYLKQPETWRPLDPELFDLLSRVDQNPAERRLRLIEESRIVPGAIYFNDTLSDGLEERAAYFHAARLALSGSDLVFFDPDNGLDVPSVTRGRRNSSKYLYFDEAAAFYRDGKSLLIYQHFPRVKRTEFLQRLSCALERHLVGCSVRPAATPHVAFLLVVRPEHHTLKFELT